uniref:ADP-dependent glucokinase n=1 Tax=Ciona savignyi TaxID=51511 RepID=H2YHL1_CIOSA
MGVAACTYFTLAIVGISALFAYYNWNFETIVEFSGSFVNNESPSRIKVAESWSKLILQPQEEHRFKRIAVGVNGNVDIILKGSKLINALDSNASFPVYHLVDHPSLRNVKDLKETFAFHHAKGAGGERYMENGEEFRKILKAARTVDGTEYYIGGNAALMAQKLASLIPVGGEVAIGAPVGPKLKPLLHPLLQVPSSSFVDEDEYHIILEFSKGESWGGRVAPIASRFIFSHDVSNSHMSAFEPFIASLKDFKPDLIVISGLHLLESQERSYWKKRISDISELLRTLSSNIPIHVELASMANEDCTKEIATQIFPLVDSIGLNEQELWLLCRVDGGPHCSSHLSGPPSIPVANDIVGWMLKKYSSPRGSRLTRIHFHTLPFHVVAILTTSRWEKPSLVSYCRHPYCIHPSMR